MPLHKMVQEGTFRQDLLYRINTVEVHVPPLCERVEDISLLAQHYLQYYAKKYHKQVTTIARRRWINSSDTHGLATFGNSNTPSNGP